MKSSTLRTPLFTLAISASLVAALAGCTTETSTSTPTSGSTRAPSLPTPTPPVVNECVDGNAILTPTAKNPKISLTEACDTVSVVGTKGQITLGAVQHLVVEGTNNAVTVASVAKVDFGGNDNTITHGGGAPAVATGATAGNSVVATG